MHPIRNVQLGCKTDSRPGLSDCGEKVKPMSLHRDLDLISTRLRHYRHPYAGAIEESSIVVNAGTPADGSWVLET